MIDEKDFDRIRGAALERISTARRLFFWLLVATGLVEAGGLAVVVWLCDFSDPTHKLILACACLIYWTLALCVLALGVYVNLSAQRVMKSIACLGCVQH